MLHSDECAASREMRPVFEKVSRSYDDKASFETWNLEDLSPGQILEIRDSELEGSLSSGGTPYVLVFRNDTIVDSHAGAHASPNGSSSNSNRILLENILARNGILDEHHETYQTDTNIPMMETYRDMGFPALRLDGTDLSDKTFVRVDFSGSSLKNVSFRNATLRDVDFAHANLTGANFEGAEFSELEWTRTTCPDGTSSDEHDGTCRGHLASSPWRDHP